MGANCLYTGGKLSGANCLGGELSDIKSLNNLYPESLKNMFKSTSEVHSYNVRGASNNIFVPRPRTEAVKRAFSYRGVVMWNGRIGMA